MRGTNRLKKGRYRDFLFQVASQCLQSAYALNIEDKHLSVSKESYYSLEKYFVIVYILIVNLTNERGLH